MSFNPYLYFNGQCEEAFKFYEKCLAGKITFMMTWEGSPMADQSPPGWAKKVLHAGLASGDGVLEGCDAMPGEYKKPQSFCVMLRPKNAAEADGIFNALAKEGTVQQARQFRRGGSLSFIGVPTSDARATRASPTPPVFCAFRRIPKELAMSPDLGTGSD